MCIILLGPLVYSINGHFKIGDGIVEVETVQMMLKTLDASIDGFEAGLGCIFKCLAPNSHFP